MDNETINLDPERIEFDSAWYLSWNSDVAQAVRDGLWGSAWEHYVACGRREGRAPVPPPTHRHVLAAPDAGDDGPPFAAHSKARFLAPSDLALSDTKLTRIAMVGSCMLQGWGFHVRNPANCPVDFILTNNSAGLPDIADEVLASYDFMILQIPLRGLMRDDAVWHLRHDDLAGHEIAFQRATELLDFHLNNGMIWNRERGLLTFVANFFIPQHNPMGRLFPRFDLRNPEYFIMRLNEHLEHAVRQYRNAYVLDVDRISASVGRRYIQDDTVNVFGHNGFMSYSRPNFNRIEPMGSMTEHYEILWQSVMPEMVWAEMIAMYRTVRQIDPIKVVVVDLDDTMWNGISGDMTDFDPFMTEGWPAGLAESLLYLKKRGVLLAIISKNEESRIREIWPRIYGDSLRLDDFAAVRVNWLPKAESMRDILEGMNLLPRNVLFIDDNPAEREAMKTAFPDMRILGRHPLYLKRILLWAPETQVVTVSDESSRRTEMIQAQFTRETERKQLSREDFLRAAAPTLSLLTIDGTDHTRFARVFELVNKTNQFNTTGRRWKAEDMETFFRSGGHIIAFEVKDKFTLYGLVGVVMFQGRHVEQWVMSCRVLGYQIEDAVMATIVAAMREASPGEVTGRMVHTDVNFPCRDLFRKCGFAETADIGEWVLDRETALAVPDHISVEFMDALVPADG